MGFYAKGSPGSFLHLTESSDARNGIGADTIFHSDLPYIMFDGVWEVALKKLPAGATSTAQSTPYIDKDLVNYLPEMLVGQIPAGAAIALNDPSAVIITEIEYVVGGVTYTKTVGGVTLETGRHNTNFEGYSGLWSVVSTPRQGLDAYIGYYKGSETGDPRPSIKNDGSFGFSTYQMRGVSDDGDGSGATAAYNIGYNRWGSRAYRPKVGNIQTNLQGFGYNMVGILPFPRFSSPDMFPIPDGNKVKHSVVKETWMRPPSATGGRVDYGYDGIAIGLAGTFDNKFVWGGNTNGALDTYGETSRYTGVTFTKVRWYKLNLAFNIGSGFSIRDISPSSGEIKISGTEFIVRNRKFGDITSGVLYQVNSRNRPNLQLLTAGTSYASANISSDRAVMPLAGITSSGASHNTTTDNRSTVMQAGINLNYIAVVRTDKSSQWFCTQNTIGDQHGVIWGAGANKALQLLPGRGYKATVNTSTNKIPLANNSPVAVARVAMGLPSNISSTVVIAITTNDYKFVLPGDAYFCPVINGYGRLPNGSEVFGDPKYFMLPSDDTWTERKVGDHSILTLPVNKFVPIMVQRMSNLETLWDSVPRSEGVHQTSIVWLRNAGDGSVEVYITQKQDSKYAYQAGANGPASFTQLFHIPSFNIYMQRLT